MDSAPIWTTLPPELVIELCTFLPTTSILNFTSTCRSLRSIWLHHAGAIYEASIWPEIESQVECRALLSQQGHVADILDGEGVYRLLRNARKATTSLHRFEDEVVSHIKGETASKTLFEPKIRTKNRCSKRMLIFFRYRASN